MGKLRGYSSFGWVLSGPSGGSISPKESHMILFKSRTTLAKKIETAAHVAQARDLSSMHAPMFGLRACFNFFGQGSTSTIVLKHYGKSKSPWAETMFDQLFRCTRTTIDMR